MCMYYPKRWELAWRFHVLMGLLSAFFCPATTAVCLGKTCCCYWDSKLTAWIRDLHRRAPTRRRACVQEHSAFPRRLSLPGFIVMTFQMLSSRRFQSSRPSQTFACPAWDERVFAGFCKFQVVLDASLAHGVILLSKPRFTALYWPSTVKLFKYKGQKPKASSDDRPSTRKLLFSLHLDSRALIATLRHIASTTRTAKLCTMFIPSLWRSRSIAMTRTPPNSSAALALAVLLELHDRDFSSRVAKERLSNSFAFDSFVRKQVSVKESKKKKNTVDYRIRIPAIG